MKTIIFSDENLQRFIFESLGIADSDFNDKITYFINGFMRTNGIHSYDRFCIRSTEDDCIFGMYYHEEKERYFYSVPGELNTFKYVSGDITTPVECITVRGIPRANTNSQLIVVDVKYRKLTVNA